jgi:hypothetical protein
MSCFGSYVFRIAATHGFSIDYQSKRADGGGNRWVYIGDLVAGQAIATSTGAYLSNTGIWANNSDVKRKTDFQPIDGRQVLDSVAKLPITGWRYIADSTEKRHIGPMAQDFWAAFGLGDDDTHIGTLDESGVALAAIQGLNQKLEQKDAKIDTQAIELANQRAEIQTMREQIAAQHHRVAALEFTQSELAGMQAALTELLRERAKLARTAWTAAE